MRLDDYELLDLSVRQRLDAAEIWGIAGLRAGAELEASFAARLVLARGRRACLDLDFLVGDDPWSPSVRRRVARHLESCLTCQKTRQRYPGALAMLAALAFVPAPAG